MISKIITWIKANGASVLGIIQAAIKMLKEIITAILNFVSLVFPVSKFEKFILKTRDVLNTIDGWIENIKVYLVPKV